MKAVFMDRDGTLIDELPTEIINSWDKFDIKQEVGYLKKLQEHGYKIFIITNQEGMADRRLDEDFYKATNDRLLKALTKYSVRIEKIYTCPHSTNENCACKKPKRGLIDQALRDYPIDLANSYIIGDRSSDIKLGRATRMKTVYIKSKLHPLLAEITPDYIANNLYEAVDYITNG